MMNKGKSFFGLAIAAASFAAAVPAQAQYYPAPPPPRQGSLAAEIARQAAEAAAAVAAVREAAHGFRYQSPGERFAVETCGAAAERYGRVRIHNVERNSRRSWRVAGVADPVAYNSDRGYRSDQRYQARSFTCTVRDDGRVTKFKTRRLRY